MPSTAHAAPKSPTVYTRRFFSQHSDGSRSSAEVVVPLILDRLPISSVVDVGCGIGDWLAVFLSHHVPDVLGIDGDYVDRSKLRIPKDRFVATDLAHPLVLDRRFDLALCLEVAEHISESTASAFVTSLTALSDVVLFGAAIPGQGGTNHMNEQWPDYWARLFRSHGYRALDWVRSAIWENPGVEWWYAQNTILYATEGKIAHFPKLSAGAATSSPFPNRLVHPRIFEPLQKAFALTMKNPHLPRVSWCAKALALSLCRAVTRPFQANSPSSK